MEKTEILSYAEKVLLEESEAVSNLRRYLDDDFVKSVEEILHSKGRLVRWL